MPIPVECRSCGHRLKAKDASAGKKIRCPECEEPIAVPAGGGGPKRKKRPAKKRPAPAEFDENADLDFGSLAAMERRGDSLGAGDVEPCLECGEPVGKRAAECPHCEADLVELRAEGKKKKKMEMRKQLMAASREGGLPKNFNQLLILGVLVAFGPLAMHIMLADPLLPPAPPAFRDALTIPARLWKLPDGYGDEEADKLKAFLATANDRAYVEKGDDGKYAIFGPIGDKGALQDVLKAEINANSIKSFTFD